MKVYNRKLKKIIEIEHAGAKPLEIIYKWDFLTKICIKRIISKLYGVYTKSFFSIKDIKKFIKKNNINIKLFEDKKYKNFNEFFIRKYKKLSIDKNSFISPCDSKLSVYKIDDNLKVKVKNLEYTIPELFNRTFDNLNDCYLFIFRLAVDDCHRYYYIDDGVLKDRVRIKGKFHTVSNYADKYKVYLENEREYSILETKHFGEVIYMEVGAMLIGKIVNHDKQQFKRGEEKGYFLPGGSTIILIAKDIEVDKDILEYSKKNIETIVSIGERIGIKKKM